MRSSYLTHHSLTDWLFSWLEPFRLFDSIDFMWGPGGVAATGNWVTNYVVSQVFLSFVGWMGSAKTFFLYAGIAAVGWLWVWAYLPETQGLSLQEIQQIFAARVAGDGARSRQRRQRHLLTKSSIR